MLILSCKFWGRRGGRRRHKDISHFIGIYFGVIFIKSLEFFNEGVQGFGIVLGNKELNAGGVKRELGKAGINQLAEGLSKVNRPAEHEFNIRFKILTEPSKKRGVRNFGKAAEIPEFFTEGKKKDE